VPVEAIDVGAVPVTAAVPVVSVPFVLMAYTETLPEDLFVAAPTISLIFEHCSAVARFVPVVTLVAC
jgi:hypothetical protein